MSKWFSPTYDLGAFQSIASALDLRTSGFVRSPFKSDISLPYSSMTVLALIPIDFPNQTFWGLIFPLPYVGHHSSIPQGSFLFFWIPSDCGLTTFGVGPWERPRFCLSFPSPGSSFVTETLFI